MATETYTQKINGQHSSGMPGRRTTVAEFAIVRTSGPERWIGFRDIVEVDGRSITDHRGRLLALLTSPSGAIDEARRLSDESARFNIGPVKRNLNLPVTALFFFTRQEYVMTGAENGAEVQGRAEYSDYRQFETSARIK